jgi:hypothetical protein
MIRLGEELHIHWHELKAFQRRKLASLGLNEDITNPIERESFVWLRPGIVDHLRHSTDQRNRRRRLTLIDAGLLDPNGLRATLGELDAQPYDEEFHAKAAPGHRSASGSAGVPDLNHSDKSIRSARRAIR